MFHPTQLYANRFVTALIWGGMTRAILTGCNQPKILQRPTLTAKTPVQRSILR